MKNFNYYTDALKNYANFKGRANLSQFWYFILFNFIISFVIGMIHKNIGSLYSLAVLVPSIALGARRLHDIGKSGWMQLIVLIPLVGWIWLIVLFVRKGDTRDNDYGSVVTENHSVEAEEVVEKAYNTHEEVVEKTYDTHEEENNEETFEEEIKE